MKDNMDDAISALCDLAKRRGRISEKAFRQACEQFYLEPNALEARFRLAKGIDYRDLRIKQVNNQKAALEIARRRIQEKPIRYQFRYGNLSGEIAKNRHRSAVYVGSWPTEWGVDHEFIDVKSLETRIMDWGDLRDEFPAFAERMQGRG